MAVSANTREWIDLLCRPADDGVPVIAGFGVDPLCRTNRAGRLKFDGAIIRRQQRARPGADRPDVDRGTHCGRGIPIRLIAPDYAFGLALEY